MGKSKESKIEHLTSNKPESMDNIIIKAITPDNKEIELNLEAERQRWQEFYENHNFKDKVDIPEISLTEEQIKEVQALIEQGFVDKCAIIPDHLTYQELEPEMRKGYEATYQGSNFKEDNGFDELDKQESIKQPFYRILFFKKVQNLDDDKILKATKGKSPDQMEKYLKQINQQHNTDIQGISLKDYLVIQREFAETCLPAGKATIDKNIQDKSRHMDESNWLWCLKSRFKKSSRVVGARWASSGRWLAITANDSSISNSYDGSRLSRSFEIK